MRTLTTYGAGDRREGARRRPGDRHGQGVERRAVLDLHAPRGSRVGGRHAGHVRRHPARCRANVRPHAPTSAARTTQATCSTCRRRSPPRALEKPVYAGPTDKKNAKSTFSRPSSARTARSPSNLRAPEPDFPHIVALPGVRAAEGGQRHQGGQGLCRGLLDRALPAGGPWTPGKGGTFVRNEHWDPAVRPRPQGLPRPNRRDRGARRGHCHRATAQPAGRRRPGRVVGQGVSPPCATRLVRRCRPG